MNRKGQAEIIGVAIIVLIIIFGLIFFVKIKAGNLESETKLIRSNLKANSALNALMKYNINPKEQMKDWVNRCLGGSADKCNSVKTQIDINLKLMFPDNTLYDIEAWDLDNNEVIDFETDCASGKSISASPYILENGNVQFEICT